MDTWNQRKLWTLWATVSLVVTMGGSGCESNCGDGVDDDDDGYVDCQDRECFGDPDFCATEINCTDNLDNDADGLTDCHDSDCIDEVLGPVEIDCGNLFDDDCDDLIDCEDPDCETTYYCSHEDYCDDGRDNDGDGLVDCSDPDCSGGSFCNESTQCYDNVDNDNDGLIDCQDPDCSWDTYCNESAFCGDWIDNDGDGFVDCQDPDCAYDIRCGSEAMACHDFIDNDSDGLVDCEDPDCSEEWDCDEGWHCDDGQDNDGDGLIDCQDSDCAWSVACDESANCFDGVDNDADGYTDCNDPDCTDLEACGPAAGYWEIFSEDLGVPDIVGYRIVFEPDDTSDNGYSVTATSGALETAMEPGTGGRSVSLNLGNDDSEEHELSLMGEILFYNEIYTSLFVSSNGYVTFVEGSASRSVSAEAHFLRPSVAGFRGDLNPNVGGDVTIDETSVLVAVTYDQVIAVGNSTPSTFQILFRNDGSIELYYWTLAAIDALVGISGTGGGVYPEETDFVP